MKRYEEIPELQLVFLWELHSFVAAQESQSLELAQELHSILSIPVKHLHSNLLVQKVRSLIRQINDRLPEKLNLRTKCFITSGSGEPPNRVFEIPGVLRGAHHFNALGDYCAKANFMREGFARQIGLSIDHNCTSSVIVGSGKKISTVGKVEAPFRFKDEKQQYPLTFHILPNCIHNVILGRLFLKFTKTFSDLLNKTRRIKERIVSGIASLHLLYLGESAPRFTGILNGIPQDALADSGAKVMVLDEQHAREMGVPISSGDTHRHTLVFADNSTALKSGMAYNALWSFGPYDIDQKHMLDFHILQDAPANVVLSDVFLFDNEAFSRYECYLVDEDDEDPDGFFSSP
ncbi:hypothetical protein EJ04DRAFT_32147 [Polyplosphaeria fusca]|uniref:Uncharacterized protein n=1 Tax=Polyplosphaeria fusca TaxID=682080 RepID=A0A9P4QQA5_9PLEO|nr:hypothetical protein EJ04DRAFT_32147 [Polyplosphaeria fusca]